MNKKELEQAKLRSAQRNTFIAYRMLPHTDFDSAYAQPDIYNAYDARRNIPLVFQMGADLVAISCYRKGYYDLLIAQALYRGLADASCDSCEESMGRFKLLCDGHFKHRYTKRYVPRVTLDAMYASRIGLFTSSRIEYISCFACVRENDLDELLCARVWNYIRAYTLQDPSKITNLHLRDLVMHYASHHITAVRRDIIHCPFV